MEINTLYINFDLNMLIFCKTPVPLINPSIPLATLHILTHKDRVLRGKGKGMRGKGRGILT